MNAFLVLLRRELSLTLGRGGGPLPALAFYAGLVGLLPLASGGGLLEAVGAADRLFGKRLNGHMSLESGLRFDAADASLRLADVRVDEFAFDSGGASLPLQGQRLGSLLAERLLDNVAVYRMKPEQADMLHRFGVKNADIAVTGRGVHLTLHA